MGQFMEQSENLAGLGRTVIDVDDRKFVIVEAETGIAIYAKCVLEDENARALKGVPPRFQRAFVVRPMALIGKGDAEIVAHARSHARYGNSVGKAEIAGDEPGRRITSLGKLGQIDL